MYGPLHARAHKRGKKKERRKGFLEGSGSKNQETSTGLDVAEADLVDFDPRVRANPLSDHHEEKTRVGQGAGYFVARLQATRGGRGKVNGGSGGGGGGEDEREEWMRPGVEGEAEGNGERKARVEDDRAPKYTEMSSL
ncbi:hypothetical protein B296_00005295 [Ensete ventricosum]|uniref:Uncharacterized protein n=1 Tax=Ensete ventricosum TaxID=4639 RepID=A0A427BC34_ENSVE|nr:hypothetical protein B296_00005295 [Ensete ventricosum]